MTLLNFIHRQFFLNGKTLPIERGAGVFCLSYFVSVLSALIAEWMQVECAGQSLHVCMRFLFPVQVLTSRFCQLLLTNWVQVCSASFCSPAKVVCYRVCSWLLEGCGWLMGTAARAVFIPLSSQRAWLIQVHTGTFTNIYIYIYMHRFILYLQDSL